MQLKKGTTIANRYVISGILGTGGMAIVYKAKDIKLERDVTLKVMREEYAKDDDFINRFNIEAKAAAKLSHPNIVNVYDVGKHGDIYYIVMEYIEGVTLKDIIRTKGSFTNEEILGVSIQIASALEVAHKNNIVHRDIKPQNILVTIKGDVKVTDFGIARAVNANTVTSGNNTMGSVHYFSPEQARGGYIDQKSDIYSLGITMYEMATGEIPFDDETVVAIALKHISEELPDINKKNPKIFQSVISIINKATAKVGALRFENMKIMNNELKRALASSDNEEPISSDVKNNTDVTLKLTEADLTEIRTRAMTAFFDNEDMDDINLALYDDEGDTEVYMSEKSSRSNKFVIFAGVLTALAIMLIAAHFLLKSINHGSGIISTEKTIEVPNFTGKSIDESKQIATANNFTINVAGNEYSDTIPKDYIIRQDYQPGQVYYGQTPIQVITSLGTDKVSVPDVNGLNMSQAYEKFSNTNFKIKEIYDYSDVVDMSSIIKVEPEPNTMLEKDGTVTIYISKGKETVKVTVPNVRDKAESEGAAIIKNAGLNYGGSTTEYSNQYKKGIIMSQTLVAGDQVVGGTTMSIVVSKGEAPAPSPTPTPSASVTSTSSPTSSADATTAPTKAPTTAPTAAPKESTKQLTLKPITDLTGIESVEVKVISISSKNGNKVVFDEVVQTSSFPLVIPITGSGKVEYQAYIVKNGDLLLQFDQLFDFGN